MFSVAVFWAIFLPFFWENTCVSIFNTPIGINLQYQNLDISTKFTRRFNVPKSCPKGPPCFIYITLPEDGSTAAFVNAHTNVDYSQVLIKMEKTEIYQKTQDFSIIEIPIQQRPDLEYNGERIVWSSLFRKLSPNTVYTIGIFYDNKLQITKQYKTLPDKIENNEEITILNAGDASSNSRAIKMTESIAEHSPQVLFIGGDIAYDDGIRHCYHTWDKFFQMIDIINNKQNILIPMVLGIGNHDVGLNHDPKATITLDEKSPLYMQFFPQHYKRNKDGSTEYQVPKVHERKSYFYNIIGNFIYINLDSGYLSDFGAEQRDWLEGILKKYQKLVKFVSYHVPTYGSCKYPDKDLSHKVKSMIFWNTLFDKYKVITSFENHSHLFKVTHKLIGNQKAKDGTLYLGDGCWGAFLETCQLADDPDIYKVVQRIENAYITKINATDVVHTAITTNGTVLLQEYQKINMYVK